jgi:hypothetical protein
VKKYTRWMALAENVAKMKVGNGEKRGPAKQRNVQLYIALRCGYSRLNISSSIVCHVAIGNGYVIDSCSRTPAGRKSPI